MDGAGVAWLAGGVAVGFGCVAVVEVIVVVAAAVGSALMSKGTLTVAVGVVTVGWRGARPNVAGRTKLPSMSAPSSRLAQSRQRPGMALRCSPGRRDAGGALSFICASLTRAQRGI